MGSTIQQLFHYKDRATNQFILSVLSLSIETLFSLTPTPTPTLSLNLLNKKPLQLLSGEKNKKLKVH